MAMWLSILTTRKGEDNCLERDQECKEGSSICRCKQDHHIHRSAVGNDGADYSKMEWKNSIEGFNIDCKAVSCRGYNRMKQAWLPSNVSDSSCRNDRNGDAHIWSGGVVVLHAA